MPKQLCYKCKHNQTGGIVAEDMLGNEVCAFDCDLFKDGFILQDFEKDCKDFELEDSYINCPEPVIEPPTPEDVVEVGITAIDNVFMLYDLTLKVGVKIINEELKVLKEKYKNYGGNI